jgi:hypothetical protein
MRHIFALHVNTACCGRRDAIGAVIGLDEHSLTCAEQIRVEMEKESFNTGG